MIKRVVFQILALFFLI